MNYLIDEASCTKGSNEVVSMLWHFLSSLPKKKKKHIIFNADNCIGQNQNNTLMKFFTWLCLRGYSRIIEVKFMIKGHFFHRILILATLKENIGIVMHLVLSIWPKLCGIPPELTVLKYLRVIVFLNTSWDLESSLKIYKT